MKEFLQQFQVSGIESPRFDRTDSADDSRIHCTTDGCGADGCGNGCDPAPG